MKKLYLITYDRNSGDDYQALFDRIGQCGTAWHGMQNTWFVHSDMTSRAIATHLWAAMDSNDKVFVVEVTSNASWAGFKQDATEWFQGRIAA